MTQTGKSILKSIWGIWRRHFQSGKVNARKTDNVSHIYSKKQDSYSNEKQKKLEEMCEKLFAQKDLLTTGKMQLLGLGKIKKRMGKTWPGLQKIVYQTVEGAIAKYMMRGDIFIRYKDDTYVIIFANSSPEEAQIKSTLIAEEIRIQLFEHEEKQLRNIDIEDTVSVMRTENLRKATSLKQSLDLIFQESELPKKFDTPKPKTPIELKPTIEIDPSEAAEQKPPILAAPANFYALDVNYMPLWDVKRNLLTTYLCLIRGQNPDEDPFDSHQSYFLTAESTSEKTRTDIQVLLSVARELDAMAKDKRKLFIACPVHYETLYHSESYEKYILECQKIPQEQKKFLIFLLLGMPSQLHESNIYKFSVPLRRHCYAIHAEVPLDTRTDFAIIRDCRFEAVGVRLKKDKNGEKQVLDNLTSFAQRAKHSLINKIFALDVTSLSITTSAVCADFDFLGGPIIHECVKVPDNVYRFRHENLFSDLLKEQQG